MSQITPFSGIDSRKGLSCTPARAKNGVTGPISRWANVCLPG